MNPLIEYYCSTSTLIKIYPYGSLLWTWQFTPDVGVRFAAGNIDFAESTNAMYILTIHADNSYLILTRADVSSNS